MLILTIFGAALVGAVAGILIWQGFELYKLLVEK
jgi:hypothetical protein